jgi:YD repeat-containing protein
VGVGRNSLNSWSGAGQSRVLEYNNNSDLGSERAQDGNVRTFGYDPFHRLSGVFRNNIQIGDYRYNTFNQRAYKIVGGASTAAIYGRGGVHTAFERWGTPTDAIGGLNIGYPGNTTTRNPDSGTTGTGTMIR